MAGDNFADLEHGVTEAHPRKAHQARDSAVRFVVSVIDGPDTGGQLCIDENQPSPLLIGQSPACALQLRDPQVSRRHLALEMVGERLRVLDLDSTNGTCCSGLAVRDAYLRGGESLQIGQTHCASSGTPTRRRARPASARVLVACSAAASRCSGCIRWSSGWRRPTSRS